MLSDEQVRHVAELARIYLSGDEVSKFSKQLSEVLGYVEVLNELDTEGVPETSQVTGLKNVMEKDEVNGSECDRDELLGCTELPLDSNQIRVIKTIK